ncbi:MAG TPA: C-type lectin domain-containing protein [Kofleriaceae bacterium]|nr:C-type lectin domain-containing protein [Kofleriaceae bacterium]
MRSLCGVWVAAALAALPACGFNPAGGDDDGTVEDAAADADEGDGANGGDAADVDAAMVDAAMTDARMIDARMVDAAMIDARVIDAAMIDARPPCPAAYDVQFQGSNYRFEAVAQVWQVAAVDCDGDLPGRTHLATFEVASEIDGAISAVNPGNSAEPLVGASCSAIDCSAMNAWAWVTGSTVSTMIWEPGQPDNGATEKAGAAIRDMGTWKLRNVTTSLTTRPYICECDP